jgi:hypothetical protein
MHSALGSEVEMNWGFWGVLQGCVLWFNNLINWYLKDLRFEEYVTRTQRADDHCLSIHLAAAASGRGDALWVISKTGPCVVLPSTAGAERPLKLLLGMTLSHGVPGTKQSLLENYPIDHGRGAGRIDR